MLPTIHARALRAVLERLEDFAAALPAISPEETDATLAPGALSQRVRELQSQFQEQILPLPASELSPELAGIWQALQTELHRNLRLLQTEVLRLQAARQSPTQQQRLQAVRDRLQSAISQVRSLLEA